MDLVVTTSWEGTKGESDWTCIEYKEKPTSQQAKHQQSIVVGFIFLTLFCT
jgi:hypothetical protein